MKAELTSCRGCSISAHEDLYSSRFDGRIDIQRTPTLRSRAELMMTEADGSLTMPPGQQVPIPMEPVKKV